MCGRYYIPAEATFSELDSLFDTIGGMHSGTAASPLIKRGEIFPTDTVPVITGDAVKLMKWGFEGYGGNGLIINARVETAAEKPTFKEAFSAQRCLIPAGYYFEWKKSGTKKEKYAIKQSKPIYMAGLWRQNENEALPLFVILTRPALPELGFIHDRMPVILPKRAQELWLSGKLDSREIQLLSNGVFYADCVD